jgi:dihydrofolate synthase/folylpolyglutamate synthase
MTIMTDAEAIEYIHSLKRFGSRPGLARVRALLDRLGSPERKLKFIHIAGTNGKGSVTKLCTTALEDAGYSVGMYTSPYLTAFSERIQVQGAEIAGNRLGEWITRLKPMVEEIERDQELGPVTEFELITVLALAHYASVGVDFVTFEVGLGGRLDATNVVTPLVSVITNIGWDHMEVLGNTLGAIAGEKAGIIKPGVPVVTGTRAPEALDVIEGVAREHHSRCVVIDRDFTYERLRYDSSGQDLIFRDQRGDLPLHIKLLGEHQCENAAVAAGALMELQQQGISIPDEAIQSGFARAEWAGRLEVMRRDPLVVIDGAHNTHGVAALVKAVPEYFRYHRLYMVLGILKDKQVDEMLQMLLPLADEVAICAPEYGRASSPDTLAAKVATYGKTPYVGKSVRDAVGWGIAQAKPEDMVLVAGSLYTVAEARAALLDR